MQDICIFESTKLMNLEWKFMKGVVPVEEYNLAFIKYPSLHLRHVYRIWQMDSFRRDLQPSLHFSWNFIIHITPYMTLSSYHDA